MMFDVVVAIEFAAVAENDVGSCSNSNGDDDDCLPNL
jgi:hypothetical protein